MSVMVAFTCAAPSLTQLESFQWMADQLGVKGLPQTCMLCSQQNKIIQLCGSHLEKRMSHQAGNIYYMSSICKILKHV